MFKEEGQDSPVNLKFFGVGSTMSMQFSTVYIVIQIGQKQVTLMATDTFRTVGHGIRVSDINHFTQTEVCKLHNTINDNTTFSDYTCDAKGQKDKQIS